jgi:hypothetical protein
MTARYEVQAIGNRYGVWDKVTQRWLLQGATRAAATQLAEEMNDVIGTPA